MNYPYSLSHLLKRRSFGLYSPRVYILQLTKILEHPQNLYSFVSLKIFGKIFKKPKIMSLFTVPIDDIEYCVSVIRNKEILRITEGS
jgi:hypothetical protein